MMSNKKNEKQKKSIKNYIILIAIFGLTILLVWYIAKWYEVRSDYKKETPVIRGTLNYEITSVDFYHYIMENPSSVFYMCTSSSDNCRSFEKDLKKLIIKKNLQNSIIYLNLSDSDIPEFVKSFNDNYKYKVKLTKNYPALVEFTDGKVTGLIQNTKDDILTITKVNQFLELQHITGEEQ